MVDLPDPEGPEMTMGCRDLGRLSNDSVSDIFAIVDIVELRRICVIPIRLPKCMAVYVLEVVRGAVRKKIVAKLPDVEVIFEGMRVMTLPATIDSRACTKSERQIKE